LQVDPATGQCFAAENGVDPTCVPLDIFNGFGSPSADALAYVKASGLQQGFTQEQVVSGNLTGDLGQYGLRSPWAKDGVGVNLGAEYRAEYLQLNVDRSLQLGDLYGNGAKILPQPKSGFNVSEGFGEVRVPIVQGMPWVEDLTLTGGYRYSSYNTAGAVNSYKGTAEWQVVDDFKLRASYQRAVRAPNVLELFTPNNEVLFGGQDPCAAASSPDPTVIANCQNAGGIAHAQAPNAGSGLLNCPAAQCNQLVGGNINLQPETSITRSIGGVFTPTFIQGLSATIDYFHIKVAGFLAGIAPTTTLQGCYGDSATAASQAFFCPLVFRDPGTHSIHVTGAHVTATTQNTGFLDTSGIDF
jgi:outer membrane receptor protein involved in Fe transport